MKKLFLTLLFLLIAMDLFAGGGSVYTRKGLGDLVFTNSARLFGIGGLGIAKGNSKSINYLNPAALYEIDLTRFETGLSYRGFNISDGSNSNYYSDYSFSGFSIAFPIDKDYGISAALGVVPVTRTNYEIVSTVKSGSQPGVAEDYNINYTGNGGLNKIFFAASYKLPFDFIIGASFEYYNGKFDYISKTEFDDISNNIDISYTKKIDHHGIGTNFGLISNDLSNLVGIKEIENLRFGLIFNYIGNLNSDSSLTSSTSIGTLTNAGGIAETIVPSKFGAGISFTYSKNYVIFLDYLYQPWSEYRFNGNADNGLKNFSRYSLAFEFSNPEKRLSSSIFQQMEFRFGVSYEQSQYSINGNDINRFSVFGGMSIPLGLGNTIDFGLEYALRGKTEAGLIQENQFNGMVSISFGELWFIRQER